MGRMITQLILPILLLMSLLVSCVVQEEQVAKNEVKKLEVKAEISTQAEINESLAWIGQSLNFFDEAHKSMKKGEQFESKAALNQVSVFVEEAKRSLAKAGKSTVKEEQEQIAAIGNIITTLQELRVIEFSVLNFTSQMTRLGVSSDPATIRRYITIAQTELKKTGELIKGADARISGINTENSIPQLRIVVASERAALEDIKILVSSTEQLLSAFKLFIDSAQRLSKIERNEKWNEIKEHLRISAELIRQAKEQFRTASESDVTEVAAIAIAMTDFVKKYEEFITAFDSAVDAFAAGDAETGNMLMMEAQSKLGGINVVQ